MTERELFEVALETAPAERTRYLDGACAGDVSLRSRVEALLARHAEAESFLEKPPMSVDLTGAYQPITERPGGIIGPYKLLQQIGEGGFGVVYMAEQGRPVRRMVALKIIKPGMDTAQVIARFESERQALALMDHPNIAKVFDAGATESGRPYFVMELVKGVPITEFCDKNQAAPVARLKLFVDVCHAIQHAHHKGVIHRDIKPSNVMVTLHDGAPVVKVIDFGVAKATVQKLTERTLFTVYGHMIGTPAYMSPEQAEMSGLDIDTRSDIYSLGVLLYELLTGTTPLESKRLRQAGYAEMQRLIRDEEAPRPSTRLSSLGNSATVLAGNRGLEPKRLVQLLADDLDWLVMKALEKDRSRRYGTPGSFAEDVERYLRREAILARPPSASYKLKKFAQRNRAAVLTAAMISLALFGGVTGTTIGLIQARRAEVNVRRALEQVTEEKALAQAAMTAERATKQRVFKALDELSQSVILRNLSQITVAGRASFAGMPGQKNSLPVHERKLLDKLVEYYENFCTQQPGTVDDPRLRAESYMKIGAMRRTFGDHASSLDAHQRALEIWERLTTGSSGAPEDRDRLQTSHLCVAEALTDLRRYNEALAHWQQLVDLSRPDEKGSNLWLRACGMARAGKVVEAVAEVDSLTRGVKTSHADLYNAACVLALAAGVATTDEALRNSLGNRAVEMLRLAQRRGFFRNEPKLTRLATLKLDPDLSAIRGRADFRQFVAEQELEALSAPRSEAAWVSRDLTAMAQCGLSKSDTGGQSLGSSVVLPPSRNSAPPRRAVPDDSRTIATAGAPEGSVIFSARSQDPTSHAS